MRARSPRRTSMVARFLVVLVSAGLAHTTTPTTVRAAPAPVEALLIGDSVLNGLAQGYSTAGRQALAARHSFILDTAGCRRLIAASCRIPPAAAPSNAITVLRADAGQFDRAVVVAAGYNDAPDGPLGIGAAVDAIIAEARQQGIRHVIWLTYREAGNVGQYRRSNAVLRSRTDPELVVADWATLSASLPAGWFSSDGIHLGGQAAAAMADLIGDTLDQLVPERCISGTWSGSPAPSGPPRTGATVVGGMQLLSTPARLVDTRDMPGKLGAGRVLTVPIAGLNGVPSLATAAMVSVTAVEPCADTFLTVYPCGGAPPIASMVNAVALSIVANSAIVRLSAGALCVFSPQATDVVVDVSGWVAPSGLRTAPVAPMRLVDTRPGEREALPMTQHPLAAGALLTVDVGSLPGATSAMAATVNVTAASPHGSGFISVLPGPCATVVVPAATSNLNVTIGRDVAATATVALGGGELCVYTSTVTDLVVDLQALHGTAGGATTAADPLRILDTRDSHRVGPGQSLVVDLDTAREVAIVNLTAVDPSGSGFLTLYPCGSTLPTASNLNVTAGVIVANRALASTAGTSRFCLYSSVETDVVIDLEGYVTAN